MKKLSTLFKKDPNDLGRVINEIDPANSWVSDYVSGAKATRKYDGTSCAIIDGVLYKRFDLKKGRTLPHNAIPCQEPDEITGHHPHWVKCDRNDKSNKYHFEAFDLMDVIFGDPFWDGTYELCGEKVQGNPEHINGHKLIKHGSESLFIGGITFENIREYLKSNDIEGIVFDHPSGAMCKIRKSDFGIKR